MEEKIIMFKEVRKRIFQNRVNRIYFIVDLDSNMPVIRGMSRLVECAPQ